MTEVNVDEERTVDAKDLKVMHYREKCSALEDALVDTRVQLTLTANELEKALQRIKELENPDVQETAEED